MARFPGAFRGLRRPGTVPAPGAATASPDGCRPPFAPRRASPRPPPAGESRGDGRALGIRRREEGQGQEAPRHGGRGRVPGRGRGPRPPGAGPGRCAGGDLRHAGKAPQVTELRASGGGAGPKPKAALKGRSPGPMTGIARKPKETRASPSLAVAGGGEDVRADTAAPGERLRADSGAGAARGLPVPHAPDGAGAGAVNSSSKK